MEVMFERTGLGAEDRKLLHPFFDKTQREFR